MSFKGFKKAVSRMPHTLQQNMGLIDQQKLTQDDEYDFYQQQFTDLQSLSAKLEDAAQKYRESIVKMLQHQLSFATTLSEVYSDIQGRKYPSSSSLNQEQPQWGAPRTSSLQRLQTDSTSMQRVQKFVEASQEMHDAIVPSQMIELGVQRKVVEPCRDYVAMHKLVVKVMTKRQHKCIDLDRHQLDLQKLELKSSQADSKTQHSDQRKVVKQQSAVETAQHEFDQVNGLLKQQLPVYIQCRVQFVDPVLLSLLEFHAQLFDEMHRVMVTEKQLAYGGTGSAVEAYEAERGSVNALFDDITILSGKQLQPSRKTSTVKSAASSEDQFDDAKSELPAYSPTSGGGRNPFLDGRKSIDLQGTTSRPVTSKPPPLYPAVTGTSQSQPLKPQRQGVPLPQMAPASSTKKAPPPKPAKPGHLTAVTYATAIYAFDAQQDGDLALRVGDRVEVVERTQDANGWWTGRMADGTQGVFPGSYVKLQ